MSVGAALSATTAERQITRRQRKTQTTAQVKSQKAAKKIADREERERIQEHSDEEIAPAIQRKGVEGSFGPRLIRDGVSFRVACPLMTMFKIGQKRTERGDQPTVTVQHIRAVERLRKVWEVCQTITIGTSSYGTKIGGGGESGVMSQTVQNMVNLQQSAAREVERVRGAMGPLWAPVHRIALEGQDAKAWALAVGRDERSAIGYLSAALDHLVAHYRRRDTMERPNG